MNNNYHSHKEVNLSKDKSGRWFHKTTLFRDGAVHTVIYNKDFEWISSVIQYMSGETVENIYSIDENGELSISKPLVAIDGNGNQTLLI